MTHKIARRLKWSADQMNQVDQVSTFRQGDPKNDQGGSNRAPPSISRLCEDFCMIDSQQVPNTVKFSIDSSLWWSGSKVIQDYLNGSLEEQHGYKIALWFEISRINWTERNQRWRKGWECGPMVRHGPYRWIMLDSSIGLIQVDWSHSTRLLLTFALGWPDFIGQSIRSHPINIDKEKIAVAFILHEDERWNGWYGLLATRSWSRLWSYHHESIRCDHNRDLMVTRS